MYSDEKKFVFFHPHKCGGNSINRIFGEYSNIEIKIRDSKSGKNQGSTIPDLSHCKHSTYEQYVSDFPFVQKYFKFSVFRDPFERIASWYSHKTQLESPRNATEAINFLNNGPRLSHQVDYFGIKNTVEVDFIVDFDNFERDVRHLYKVLIGKELNSVMHVNKSPLSNYADFYTYDGEISSNVVSAVKETFRRDIEFQESYMNKVSKFLKS